MGRKDGGVQGGQSDWRGPDTLGADGECRVHQGPFRGEVVGQALATFSVDSGATLAARAFWSRAILSPVHGKIRNNCEVGSVSK